MIDSTLNEIGDLLFEHEFGALIFDTASKSNNSFVFDRFIFGVTSVGKLNQGNVEYDVIRTF